MRKILNYALYDFANSSFTTIIITFIFATYFAQQIVKDPILGQSYWGWAIGVSGFAVAVTGPFLGAISDKKNLKEKKFLETILNNYNFLVIELKNLEELFELAENENNMEVINDCVKKINFLF